MKENIIAGWSGASLFPENMHQVLNQLDDSELTPKTPPSNGTTFTLFFPNSC